MRTWETLLDITSTQQSILRTLRETGSDLAALARDEDGDADTLRLRLLEIAERLEGVGGKS